MELSAGLGFAGLGTTGLGFSDEAPPAPPGDQTIDLSGIASGFAAGAFDVVGNQTVTIPGIGSAIAIGAFVVAGPVILTGIPSSFAAGSFLVNQVQTISLSGIASGFAAGSFGVFHTTNIFPAGIASGFAAGSFTVFGSPQFVLLSGIPAPAVGTPTVVGGVQTVQCFIGNTNQTAHFRAEIAQIQAQTIGRWQATFDMFYSAGEYTPLVGQTCIIMDAGRKLFMGCMTDVIVDRALSTAADITYHCTATDKSGILDHRIVTIASFAAGSEVADAVRYLVNNFLVGEGISLAGIPAAIDTLDADYNPYMVTVRQALDALATQTGCTWWIDVNGVLYFSPFDELGPCPFALSETSGNWRGLTVEYSLVDYKNKVYAVSNLNVLPGDGTSSGFQHEETFTLPQAAAVAAGFYFGALILQYPATSIVSFKVNGVEHKVEPATLDNPDLDFTTLDPFSPFWWWFSGTPYINPPLTGALVPNPGDVVDIQYMSNVQSASLPAITGALAPTSGTCGSGLYEAVEQVNNVDNQEDLNAIASAIVSRSGSVPTLLKFETDTPGAAVGQLLSVDIAAVGLPSTQLLITSVSGLSYGTDLGHDSSFRWQIEAVLPADLGNWVKWFERLVARSEHPLPVDQYEEATFILAPGGSLSSGVVPTNPYIVGHTGRLIEALAVAGDVSTDEDLYLDVSDSLIGSLFGSTPLKIPAGSGGLVVWTSFAQPAVYVYAQDVLTVSAAYSVVGPNPAPAGSVTFKLRWAF